MNKHSLSGGIRKVFPNLTNNNHLIASPKTDNYNCIAWSFEVNSKCMWPSTTGYYWPFETITIDPLENMLAGYLENGYEKCDSPDLEAGFKKVAIYVGPEGPRHAALQLESGKWTSKLGNLEDIQHDTLECLESEAYGKAVVFLRKRRN